MKKSSFTAKTSAVLVALIASVSLVSLARADELQALPAAESAVAPTKNERSIAAETEPRVAPALSARPPVATRIFSEIPAYTERGVIMIPLRPLAQFLRLRVRNVLGVTIVERSAMDGASPDLRLMIRSGSSKSQVERNGVTRGINLPIPAQTRLGNTFVPARAISTVFGAKTQAVPKEKGILLNFEGRSCLFSSIAPNSYRGADAARVVIENNVGKALSLHLSGPQSVRIELGSRERITRNLRPGVYIFKAASSGMKTRSGTRRFAVRQRAVWNWGRK